ncbi:MAG TPA: cyclase family protein [Acidimicrobiales bacterium]
MTSATSLEQVHELGRRVSNWGRWGPDDEHGALNHIGPEQLVGAAATVRQGRTISMSIPLRDGYGPQTGYIQRNNPVHVMTYTGEAPSGVPMGGGSDFTDDYVVLSCHGSTQWDALAHLHYDGQLYNGVAADTVTADGADLLGIDKVHSDLVGRGVLLDMARHFGVECCDPERPIHAEDLVECADRQGVTVGTGDILVVRTGVMTLVDDDDWSAFHRPQPGVHHSVAEWLWEREVAAIASDNVQVEAPSDVPGVMAPMHMVALRDMGLHLGELWYLEDLGDDCAHDGVYEFFLAAQALQIVGGCGSPVNPIAVK